MTRANHSGLTCRLFSADWWLRLLAVVVFAYSVNSERAHLSLEAHLEVAPSAQGEPRSEDAFELASLTENHHHEAHPAGEHSIRMAQAARSMPIIVAGEPVVPSADTTLPAPYLPLFLTERQNPPGIPAPDPRQPRAPPIV
jgi:hypothetical protein